MVPRSALRHASTVAGLLAWTREALATAHLVEVATALVGELRLELDDLHALKLPVDLLTAFPNWAQGSTAGFTPLPLGVAQLPQAAADPIDAVRLHISPATGSTPIVFHLLRGLQQRVAPSPSLVVLVEPDADLNALDRLARQTLGRRPAPQFIRADFGTIFARDNALAARDAKGRPVLVVPRALRTPTDPSVEAMDAKRVARSLGVRVVTSRLYWHGGNMNFDGVTLAVGADTIAENCTRLGLTADEVVRLFAAELGASVLVLGAAGSSRFDAARNRVVPSLQATYHIDLDVALLGRVRPGEPPVAIVADSRLGLRYVSAVLARARSSTLGPLARTDAVLRTEYVQAAERREPVLNAYREALRDRGYTNVSVPELRTRALADDLAGLGSEDVSYCNVLTGAHRGKPAIYYVPWGVPAIDSLAERAMRSTGARPIAISRAPGLARAMMERGAGLRCFCGAMTRGQVRRVR